jgi:acetylornithine deacetylase/succinyl-diaminopimelate desuccinylase-like protein
MARRHAGTRSEHPGERGLTTLERRVAQRIAERETELVELLRSLINFDTITPSDGAPARQEAELQQLLATRLERCGAEARLLEPDRAAIGDRLIVPEGFSLAGRPQLVARFAGAGADAALEWPHRCGRRAAVRRLVERSVRGVGSSRRGLGSRSM